MGFLKEFKEFAIKGNVMDLAVGVIIGGAFGKIIDSVVGDLIMPIVAAVIGQPDFSNLYKVLKGNVPEGTSLAAAKEIDGAVIFAYGNFITVFINFLLLAFVVFLLVRTMNRLRKKQELEPEVPAPTPTEKLLEEIRDELKRK
jgi:large conductance mechanosensitive channel